MLSPSEMYLATGARRLFQAKLILQVAYLALSDLSLMTIPFAYASCYPGLKRSLPIFSSRQAGTRASWHDAPNARLS